MFGGMDGGFSGGGMNMNIDPSMFFNMMNGGGGTTSYNFGSGGAGGRRRPGPHDFTSNFQF